MSTAFFQQRPKYSVDIRNSKYTSYDITNGIYVFNVEQGRQFLLRLNGYAGTGQPDLYQNGEKLMPSRSGTINVESNSVGIQFVNASHEGTYTIRSPNGAELTYRLSITGTEILSYF